MFGGKNLVLFLLVTSFILFLNAFPNYYAYLKTPENMHFSGQASWFDPWDINVYVAAIKWGQQGHFLLHNAYTTAPHQPALIYPFYTLAGNIFIKVQPFLLFHLLALFTGIILVITIYFLSGIFLKGFKEKLLALFLISCGGGFGWLLFPNIESSDLFMTGFTFVSHFQRPHEAIGIIFYLLSLILFYIAVINKRWLFSFLSLFFLSLLIIFYPYYPLSYFLINGLFSLLHFFQKQKIKQFAFLIINFFICLPLFLIYYFTLKDNPGFAGLLSQDLSPQNLIPLLLGYGILTPLFLFQLKNPQKNNEIIFLNIWVFTSLLLSILPFGFARFYLRSLFFPIVILILLNIPYFVQKLKFNSKIIMWILLFTLPLSTLYMTYKRMEEAKHNNPWFYQSSSEKELLNFLKEKISINSNVLAYYQLSNKIPAITYHNVYFGHLLQTPNAEKKVDNLAKFYKQSFSARLQPADKNDLNQEQVMKWFKDEQINLVVTENNQTLNYSFLKLIWQNSSLKLYSVFTN